MGVNMIKLHRGSNAPSESTILSDTEFMDAVLDTISSTAQEMKSYNETDKTVYAIANILELLNAYQVKNNIKPDVLMEHVKNIRSTDGTFMDKKATITENDDE